MADAKISGLADRASPPVKTLMQNGDENQI